MLRYGGKPVDFDLRLALVQIEARRRHRRKLGWLLEHPHVLIPDPLSAEQASNHLVAAWHSRLLPAPSSILDMTAGLGMDALSMACVGHTVTAVDLDPARAQALSENIATLGLSDKMRSVNADSVALLKDLLADSYDAIFIDPHRRDDNGGRTYALSDCTPDVLQILPEMLRVSPNVLIKASPLLDVKAIAREIPSLDDFYAVSAEGECKEVLLHITRKQPSQINFHSVDLYEEYNISLQFQGEDISSPAWLLSSPDEVVPGQWLYEPSPSLMKLAPWQDLCRQGDMKAFGPNCHLFLASLPHPELPGRWLQIESVPTGKQAKRLKGEALNVATRDYPRPAAALQRDLAIKRGSPTHFLYGCRAAGKPLLVVAGLKDNQ